MGRVGSIQPCPLRSFAGLVQKRLEATLRYHRFGAVTGKIYDADGSRVLLDLHQRFGITAQSVAMTLGTETTDLQQKIRDAKRKSEDVIGDSGVITGWLGICGRGFYDAFVGHATVKQAYDRWNDGQFLRGVHQGFGRHVFGRQQHCRPARHHRPRQTRVAGRVVGRVAPFESQLLFEGPAGLFQAGAHLVHAEPIRLARAGTHEGDDARHGGGLRACRRAGRQQGSDGGNEDGPKAARNGEHAPA